MFATNISWSGRGQDEYRRITFRTVEDGVPRREDVQIARKSIVVDRFNPGKKEEKLLGLEISRVDYAQSRSDDDSSPLVMI